MQNNRKDDATSSRTIDVTAPWQAPIDHRVMQRAEQRVIKQLLQALLYENIIVFEYASAESSND